MPQSVTSTKRSDSSSLSRVVVVMVCLLQVLALALGVRAYLTYTNTLANNPDWVIGKSALFFPGHDDVTFRDYPAALATHSLNLAAWRGYHEVFTQKTFNWRELQFQFQPTDHGYLYVVFDKSATEFSALRLSFTPLYRPALIRARYTGEFLSQETLSDLPYTHQKWQDLTLKRSATQTAHYALFLNQTFVTEFVASSSAVVSTDSATAIGFRGGQKPVYVDSVKLLGDDGKLLFSDNFDHQEQFWFLTGILSATALMITRIVFLALKTQPTKLKSYFQINFVLSFSLVLLFVAALVLSPLIRNRYPNFDHWWYKLLQGPTNNANGYLINKTEWMFADHPIEKLPQTKRVLIVGASQIDGEGISESGQDISNVLARLLKQKLTTKNQNWEVINGGVSGQGIVDLLEAFRYQWLKLQPDLVIVNVGSNDEAFAKQSDIPPDFKESLESFVSLAQTHNFTLVFSAEPNAIETLPELRTHAIMEEVAKEHNVLLLQTHNYVATQTDKGILWWDFVHMTSFGYQLVAEFFFKELESVLRHL